MLDYNLNLSELSETFYDTLSTRPLDEVILALEDASRRRAADLRGTGPEDFDPYLAVANGLRTLQETDFNLDENDEPVLQ